MNKYILSNPLYYDPKDAKRESEVKGKLSRCAKAFPIMTSLQILALPGIYCHLLQRGHQSSGSPMEA